MTEEDNGLWDLIVSKVTSKNRLIQQLKSIEPHYVQQQLKKEYKPVTPNAYGINPRYKEKLETLRQEVAVELKDLDGDEKIAQEDRVNRTQKLFQKISQRMKALITEMVKECMELMGEGGPPCDYAILASGSLAREEMTPYSDLEFMIAIEDLKENDPIKKQSKEEKCRFYFRQLSTLLELKIINLGETDILKGQHFFPKMKLDFDLVVSMENPISKGFSLDVHKNPNDPTHELIDTPAHLARYQSQDPRYFVHKKDDHLSSSLLTVTLVTGQNGSELYAAYQKAIKDIYRKEKTNLTRALQFLKEDSERFKPKLELEHEGAFLSVKEDLYRLPNAILDGLALYYQLESSSTWRRIDELCQPDDNTKRPVILAMEAGKRLKKVFSTAARMRLQTYNHYRAQHEAVDALLCLDKAISNHTDTMVSASHYGLPVKDKEQLMEIYKTLIPLHEICESFSGKELTENPFQGSLLYDNSDLTTGLIASRIHNYEEAKQAYNKFLNSLSCDSHRDRILALNLLGITEMALGHMENARNFLEDAACIIQKEKDSSDFSDLGDDEKKDCLKIRPMNTIITKEDCTTTTVGSSSSLLHSSSSCASSKKILEREKKNNLLGGSEQDIVLSTLDGKESLLEKELKGKKQKV